MKTVTNIIFALLLMCGGAAAQQKKPISHDVYDDWKSIVNSQVSPNGKFIGYVLEPQEGDATQVFHNLTTKEQRLFERGVDGRFSSDSEFLVFKIKPRLDSLKAMRRRRMKPEDLPKDSLGIFDVQKNAVVKIPRVKAFKMPEKAGGWLAYHLERPAPPKDPARPDTSRRAAKAPKKEDDENGTRLVLRNLNTGKELSFGFVTDFEFSENGKRLMFATTGNDSSMQAGIYLVDLATQTLKPICRAKGKYKFLIFDEQGDQAAFLSSTDTSKSRIRFYDLRYWQSGAGDSAVVLADTNAAALPKQWLVSEYRKPMFSKNGKRLFFGSAPRPLLPDTTRLPEEIVSVDIWHWRDGEIQAQQNATLKQQRERSYLAAIDLTTKKMLQVATKDMDEIALGSDGDASVALGFSDNAYQVQRTWEGGPPRVDVYLINLADGSRKLVKKNERAYGTRFSPDSKYVVWYSSPERSWFSYQVLTGETANLTKKDRKFYDELHDSPDDPAPYGAAGFTEGDKSLLLYDRYDIWELDPTGKTAPKRLTKGRETKTRYRYIQLDDEERRINSAAPILLEAFNETTKGESYCSMSLTRADAPKTLYSANAALSVPRKAKHADQVIFTRSTFTEFPNIWTSDLTFQSPTKLSDANPQQKNYLWGTVELVDWKSLDGQNLQGLLYKPENFDATKKYPMIVYYYERNSDGLHRFISPAPSASTISPSIYASNGYLVFIPDIPYKIGYPGQSAFNSIVSGTRALIAKGFVNEKKIGLQGQSWGGYQTAFLITRTTMYAAAMAGAPVANMTSAYGGIRWGPGILRQFQYEHTQSRIGATPWQKLNLYLENSPLFKADKIETPLLMMHNDADDAVPWYQGIEMYSALRRLQKPVWMLTYNGEKHNLTQRKNRKDLSIRMMQFFDHYLKDAPMPVWMKDGVPAIEKSINMGYELTGAGGGTTMGATEGEK